MKELQKTLDQQKLNNPSSSLGPFLDSHGITIFKGGDYEVCFAL